MSDVSPIVDEPTHRVQLTELSIAQQEVFLEGIRERRLNALRVYEQVQAAKKQARDEKLAVKAGKLISRMEKRVIALDKSITDLEALLKDAKAMLILLGGDQ